MTDDNDKTSHKWDAYKMFGEMRPSTEEERHLYSEMLRKLSRPIMPGESIFDLLDSEKTDTKTKPTESPSPQA